MLSGGCEAVTQDGDIPLCPLMEHMAGHSRHCALCLCTPLCSECSAWAAVLVVMVSCDFDIDNPL